MLLPLLQSAALLAGMGSSARVGEMSPFPALVADVRYRSLSAETRVDGAHKLETRQGWLWHSGADLWAGPLSVGAGYTRRDGGPWVKHVLWLRAGAQHGPLRLLAEVAPSSRNREMRLEARYRMRAGRLACELRGWVEDHSQTAQVGGYGTGADVLIGVAR